MELKQVLQEFWKNQDWLDDQSNLKSEKVIEILLKASSLLEYNEIEELDLYKETIKIFCKENQVIEPIKLSGTSFFGSTNFRFKFFTDGSFEKVLDKYLNNESQSTLDHVKKLFDLQKISAILEEIGLSLDIAASLKNKNVHLVVKAMPVPIEKKAGNSVQYDLNYKLFLNDGTSFDVSDSDFFGDRGYLKRGNDYILLPEDVVGAVTKQKQLKGLNKREMHSLLSNPLGSLFPDGTDLNKFDLSEYDKRVAGFEYLKKSSSNEIISSGVEWYRKDTEEVPYLKIRNTEGEIKQLLIDESTDDLIEKIKVSIESGYKGPDGNALPVELVSGDYIAATEDHYTILKACKKVVKEKEKTKTKPESSRGNLVAIIQEIEIQGDARNRPKIKFSKEQLAKYLKPKIKLKDHQVDGVNWLINSFIQDDGGVILADDMGLGKTLQMILFITIIRNLKSIEELKNYTLEYDLSRPVMIVAPLILLKNWDNEFKKFLSEEFQPVVFQLYGKNLKKIIEEKDGLSKEWWRKGVDIIITNYNTFSRNQQSLLKIKYFINIFDESQNIKNPDTAQTRAARGLINYFSICATGTPVENRLLDLWPQVSTLNRKPLNPLGSIEEFKRIEESEDKISITRNLLGFTSELPILLRRDKSLLRKNGELKEKIIHDPVLAIMTDFQIEQEQFIVGHFKSKPLQILQHLQKLYQHPALLNDDYITRSTEWLINSSPKLLATIDLLNKIKSKNEKVLVFTLWIGMQAILQKVLSEKFGLKVKIINGETNSKKTASSSADAIIEDFSMESGFNILILSPLAAGAGLNITAANHVIHYGRWWNPAKEDQGTDRAYRIGQEKDVHVYYPVLQQPNGDGFDLKLHNDVIRNKRELATDVLVPLNDLDVKIS